MGLPVFRFTLSHANLGTLIVSEPDGWKTAKLKLERHPDFHSLVEYFEGSFIHYGENNVDIGGADFIKQCENIYGFNTDIVDTIDVSFDGEVYENIFTGLKDLTGLQETQDNKIDVPTIPSTLWSKFISRLETPVNLRSTTDLDGNPVTPVEPVDINLPSQRIRQRYEGHHSDDTTVQYTIPDFQYGQIDFARVVLDEIDHKSNLPLLSNSERPFDLFRLEYGGNYQFDIQIYTFTGPLIGSLATDTNLQVRLQINDDAAITLSQVGESSGIDAWTKHVYNSSISLEAGDLVRLYFYNNNVTGTDYTFSLFANIFHDSRMIITADTVFPSSDAKGFYLHDVFAGIIHRTLGTNSFYSEVLGRTDTNMRTYASNGCYSNFAILKGLHIRGYLLEDKIFSISFIQAWKGADPIFNLGLRKETILGTEYIRIEQKSAEYDASSISLFVDNIRTILREYDHSKIYNSIQTGFTKWQSEDSSGNDDPQTKSEWSTIVSKIKNKLTIYSEFIAASIAIETTRRNTVNISADYKFDDDNFIICLNEDDVSPDRYRPELGETFNSISGLLNSETRYNTILTPLRSLLRWGNVWNGCLQKYQSTSLKFVSGEGNYSLTTDYNCASGKQCQAIICDSLTHSADLPLGAPSNYGGVFGYLHLPLLYTIEVINFSWDEYLTIRNSRTKCIAISQSIDNYKRFFIKELTYELCKSKARIVAWAYDETPIRVIQTDIPDRDYDDDLPEDCGDRVRLLEDGDERITESGECRNLEDGGTKFFYMQSEGQDAEYIYQDSEIPPADTDYFYQVSEI